VGLEKPYLKPIYNVSYPTGFRVEQDKFNYVGRAGWSGQLFTCPLDLIFFFLKGWDYWFINQNNWIDREMV
jgi:hypothetical protein